MILALLGLLAAALGFGGVSELRHAEHAAAGQLHAKLGPDSKVRVRFMPSGSASVHGDLAAVSVRARDFALDGLPWYVDPSAPHDGRIKELRIRLEHGQAHGYALDLFEAKLPEVRYDFGTARHGGDLIVSACGDGTFRIEMSEETLAADAIKKSPVLSGLSVTVENGRMTVRGKAKTPFGVLDITADGKFAVHGGHELALEDPQLTVGGNPVGPESAASLLGSLNPLLDLDKELGQPGMLQLQTDTTENHKLVLRGVMRLPIKPSASPPSREGREGDPFPDAFISLTDHSRSDRCPSRRFTSPIRKLEFTPLNPPSRGEGSAR